MILQILPETLGHPVPGDRVEHAPVEGPERREVELAQTNGPFEYRVEHRTEVARRGIDNLQYLGRRSLLFQGLALFGYQSCVFDRDHRLIGEGADEFDLAIGEWLHALAAECEYTNRFAFP